MFAGEPALKKRCFMKKFFGDFLAIYRLERNIRKKLKSRGRTRSTQNQAISRFLALVLFGDYSPEKACGRVLFEDEYELLELPLP